MGNAGSGGWSNASNWVFFLERAEGQKRLKT
jgi:hypothetical protein